MLRTMPLMLRTLPPFRADQVGSLLRPAELKEARAQYQNGAISVERLKTVEDKAIVNLIAKQEAIGLKGITDGEFRREFWHFDFLAGLDGVELYESGQGIKFKGADTKPKSLRVTGKIGYTSHPIVEHYKYLRDHAHQTPKVMIPSPGVLHFRGGRASIPQSIYPDMEAFYDDLGNAYRKCVRALADEGCRYLQIDDTPFAYFCDVDQCKMLVDRGDDPDQVSRSYARMINTAISDIPADMRITMHLCRGNFKSLWIGQGGYAPVAELLFNGVNVDAYFMEYDTERAGGFEPLRFVPKNKTVVLGLVTSKTGVLESKDELKRRIDEAAKFIDLDQLCLSPQCGFASTEEGNLLSEDEQWAKLELVVETASEVWQ
jgi:5-methyltetrahydropteroyltriglutamate--homocysteine methyltransferase